MRKKYPLTDEEKKKRKLIKAIKKIYKKPRKKFGKKTKAAAVYNQNSRCNNCYCVLDVYIVEYDHIDGDSSNNHYTNCQALCANCHARKTRKKK